VSGSNANRTNGVRMIGKAIITANDYP
jgi:hypothetical protein